MSDWADSDGWIVAKGGPAIPVGEVTVLADDYSHMSFANIQWPQFTFSPKREPSPDARPAIAGLMRVRDL